MHLQKIYKTFCVFYCRLLTDAPEQRIVRSMRLLKKQTRGRKGPRPTIELQETSNNAKPGSREKLDQRFDPNDPLRLFLRGSGTTQLLTAPEESDLIQKIQVSYCPCHLLCG